MSNNEEIFTIPADYKIETIKKIVEMNKNIDIKVKEVYGSYKKSLYGSGRKNSILPDVDFEKFKEYILFCNENRIKFNYTLNLNCMENREFTVCGKKELRKEIQKFVDMGIRDFTIAMPSIIDIFEKDFPNINITVSIIEGIDTLQKLMYFCKYKNVKNIYIHEKLYRRIDVLKKMTDIAHKYNKNVGIIVNSLCLAECPFRESHYNFSSHANKSDEYIIPEYYSTKCGIEKLMDKRKVLTLPWVRPEDLKMYGKIGIDRLKISGRELYAKNGDVLKMVEIYSSYEYKGNLMELFKGFIKCSYTDIYYIDNDNNIAEFLQKIFAGKINCNINGCTNCMECKEALKSIRVNEKNLEKWKKIYLERINKFKNS